VVTPDGLAFDWVYKHLYWTDTATNTIHMACPEDAENPMKVILYENSDANCVTDPTDTSVPPSPVCIDEPRALAMHPERVSTRSHSTITELAKSIAIILG